MKRFWILFLTELKAWLHDPITAMGGVIPSLIILIAFGVLFGGNLSFRIGLVDYDQVVYADLLRESFDEAISPLNNMPYYEVIELDVDQAREEFEAFHLEGYWIIPADFSERMRKGDHPQIEMVFNNYNDDRAKNHRIYAAEILWLFYEKAGLPAPPMELDETYPAKNMIQWFPLIAVGVVLMATMLGGMMNIFMLTYKEHVAGVTVEIGLSPRNLSMVLLAKVLLALLMSWITGLLILLFCYLWIGIWPGKYLAAVLVLSGLVALFWIGFALLLGLNTRDYMTGAIISILTGILVFFSSGGLNIARYSFKDVPWYEWIFPFIYAVDPMRDLILVRVWPVDWWRTVLILSGYAVLGLGSGLFLAAHRLRRPL
ncbi:MAG: ABC transporter permease [Anaerolineaceae bacterium]|nr:ABC transporter permease [Anaerolineaceae bacterium]